MAAKIRKCTSTEMSSLWRLQAPSSSCALCVFALLRAISALGAYRSGFSMFQLPQTASNCRLPPRVCSPPTSVHEASLLAHRRSPSVRTSERSNVRTTERLSVCLAVCRGYRFAAICLLSSLLVSHFCNLCVLPRARLDPPPPRSAMCIIHS